MFRLTREVRFAANPVDAHNDLSQRPGNSYGGFPSLRGFGNYLTLQITLSGNLETSSNYLVNIKQIDAVVRERAIPRVIRDVRQGSETTPERTVAALFEPLRDAWPGLRLEAVRLSLSPFCSYLILASEMPMVRLSQKFEFSATHRLHNAALSDDENCRIFGKCNNPHGHGHNYEVQVTLAGQPNGNGELIEMPVFERMVASTVIDRFDHKNLNVELPEFREVNPTVENIAKVIFGLLKSPIGGAGAKLATVTVWETPKTWCEYGEE